MTIRLKVNILFYGLSLWISCCFIVRLFNALVVAKTRFVFSDAPICFTSVKCCPISFISWKQLTNPDVVQGSVKGHGLFRRAKSWSKPSSWWFYEENRNSPQSECEELHYTKRLENVFSEVRQWMSLSINNRSVYFSSSQDSTHIILIHGLVLLSRGYHMFNDTSLTVVHLQPLVTDLT